MINLPEVWKLILGARPSRPLLDLSSSEEWIDEFEVAGLCCCCS
jgi:hypothetical protein